MATLFRNPHVADRFAEHRGTGSLVERYEAGEVILLPDLKPEIDHDFWASVPVDTFPALTKLSFLEDQRDRAEKILAKSGFPAGLAQDLARHMRALFEQVMPAYERLFDGYRFMKRKTVWRLTEQLNENMHVDAYDAPNEGHFARMFINLDSQPRIWQVSHPLTRIHEKSGMEAIPVEAGAEALNAYHGEANRRMFGPIRGPSLEREPYHVVYFDPGDVWVVDSRQVAHQIFYGRRAVSIDFSVDPASMRDPSRHYLALAATKGH